MKALVLTFDKYRVFADHMIYRYQILWPNNPFIFRIPYQGEDVKEFYETKYGNKVEMKKSKPGIVETINTLLEELNDNEWIYWCLDDRYPVKIDIKGYQKLYEWVTNKIDDYEITGVRGINFPLGRMPESIYYFRFRIKTDDNQILYRRKNYYMFWSHQYFRVKVLRYVFSKMPKLLGSAKEMDYIVNTLKFNTEHFLYVLKKNVIVLGESATRGRLTKNCYESLSQNGFEIPVQFSLSKKEIIYGSQDSFINQSIFILRKMIKYILKLMGFKSYIRKRDVKSGLLSND